MTVYNNIKAGKAKCYGNLSVSEVYEYDIDSTEAELDRYCVDCDFVFNLAGVNRPQNQDEFMKGNFGFASKLLEIKQMEHEKKLGQLKGENVDVNFGSQIRSYVFCPYTLVKDHRTNYEVGNVEAVMNGEIDGFIEACLKNNIT